MFSFATRVKKYKPKNALEESSSDHCKGFCCAEPLGGDEVS